MGPMTGRAAGYCAGYGVPGFLNPAFGGGWGRGGGWGWGRRNWFYATGLTGWQRAAYSQPAWGGARALPTAAPFPGPFAAPTREQQIEALQSQAENLDNALQGIRRRIEELEAEGEKD